MMKFVFLSVLLFGGSALASIHSITLSASSYSIQTGDTVLLTATISQDVGTVATVWPYVNGYQWGSGASLSPSLSVGNVTILLPLPRPAAATQVLLADTLPGVTFPVGQPLPPNSVVSNAISIEVTKRAIVKPPPLDTKFGMEWEPWFTPDNAPWSLAEATPLVGFYNSCNTDVIVQHAIWFAQMGVDYLLVDWTNNIWNLPNWTEHGPGVDQLIQGFRCALDTYAELKQEGLIPVPQVLLLLGLDNGVQANMACLNEEIEWTWNNFTSNPKYSDLWVNIDGKPVMVVFDGGNEHASEKPPVDDTHYTIRWMASQLQNTPNWGTQGFWSWMDGSIVPVAGMQNGVAESLTITNAYFADGGWLAPTARGQLGGSTLMEEFKTALKVKPQFLALCQWNEFIGQPEGQGYGPDHNIYVDIYNVTFSNDMEPTSLTQPGYRSGRGGWGLYYVNAVRAMRDLYQQMLYPELSSGEPIVLISLASPDREQNVTGSTVSVQWTTVGPLDGSSLSFSVQLNGVTVAQHLTANSYQLDVSKAPAGKATVTVLVENRTTQYPLSSDTVDIVPLQTPIPLLVSVDFNIVH